jgi:hypothetical protein
MIAITLPTYDPDHYLGNVFSNLGLALTVPAFGRSISVKVSQEEDFHCPISAFLCTLTPPPLSCNPFKALQAKAASGEVE